MRLKGKNIIITGAAHGIGKAMASLFASEGAHVVVTDLDEKVGNIVTKDILDQGGKATFFTHDVQIEDSWKQLIYNTEETVGPVHSLINNAGVFQLKPLIEFTVDEWERLFKVNVHGTFLGLKYVIPTMIRNGGGSIVNNSSTAGLIGSIHGSGYGTTKGAIRSLTKHAALEYASSGIRINCLFPGFVDTDMMRYRGQMENNDLDEHGKKVPLGRVGTPNEIANTALFLVSDESSYTTGGEFVIDGGRTLGMKV